ncbi:MAG: AmmeMemoRadiSam system protein B [Candidatus Methanomethyliales bacterium]|nr:AmmeMemoRadiSam system protein B [Candidatus Methanomethylicales archaeon]
MKDRRPSVAGSFYESSADAIRNQMIWCFLHRIGPRSLPTGIESTERRILALVSPHAGYIYSGPVAAHGYYQLSKEPVPEVIVIIGPNHTGMGAGISVWGEGTWSTPLGRVPVDADIAEDLANKGIVEIDQEAHLYEHSIEVQLPFLQFIYQNKEFKILPICMMLQDYMTSLELGNALAESLKGKSSLIVASTDFSHYVPYSEAYRKDSLVSECIVKMDAKALSETVIRENVSMCGPGPVMATIVAAKRLGAKECRKLCYATSGDTCGSKDEVVGYGSYIMVL